MVNFANSATFMEPRRVVEPGGWVGHIPFAFWLVDAMRPQTIVELGTHTGNSFCAFLQAAEAIGGDTKVFAIDHWRGDEHSGEYSGAVFEELAAYVNAIYPGQASMVRSSFDDAVHQFEDGSIDLLHIDGMHGYEAVRHDFVTWLPKIKPTGIVLLHDTQVKVREFGVGLFFRELAAGYRTAELTHSHGLGIIALGDQCEPISALLDGKPDTIGLAYRQVFERMGNAVLDRYHASRLAILSDPGSPLGDLKGRIRNLKEDIDVLAVGIGRELEIGSSFRSSYLETGNSVELLIPSILSTPYFSPKYYKQKINRDDLNDWELCRHYLLLGEAQGLSPSPDFDPHFYKRRYPDVAASHYGALEHFVLLGQREGRLPTRGSEPGAPDVEWK